jgi:hypothetical protein
VVKNKRTHYFDPRPNRIDFHCMERRLKMVIPANQKTVKRKQQQAPQITVDFTFKGDHDEVLDRIIELYERNQLDCLAYTSSKGMGEATLPKRMLSDFKAIEGVMSVTARQSTRMRTQRAVRQKPFAEQRHLAHAKIVAKGSKSGGISREVRVKKTVRA